ncbi:putative toxin-antitoxin system toxin component, PIN family [Larkinella punicea]|uniref:Putative toxin-antitoxin system toxin component, PIN family n=1 Tax=Larkinella punicea TaxID=2315727 RepID=A0A368JS59_9BACT|nr:putative toxin-antitoxin system toxin component, PIN family [Larkinella punicea]RCR70302.1 putative toxin-antitoxin system toxin component, PIN family [Larkinella punicea]
METRPSLLASTVIVFDTNVFISTFVFPGFSAKVHDFCAVNFQLFTSEWILNELDEKLGLPKFRCSIERRSAINEIIRIRHQVVFPDSELPTVCRDADDNHILQVAQFVDADFIITGDRDLLDLITFEKTQILSPREFYNRYIQQ